MGLGCVSKLDYSLSTLGVTKEADKIGFLRQ
jgi:hypothetical protein